MSELSLAQEFDEKIRAGMPGIMIRSFEPEDALRELRAHCRSKSRGWKLATFDLDRGILVDDIREHKFHAIPRFWTEESPGVVKYKLHDETQCKDFAQVIRGLPGLVQGLKTSSDQSITGILVVLNHQYVVTLPSVVQLLANRLAQYKEMGVHIAFLSPTSELPLPLQKLFEAGHIRHRLPDRKEVIEIILGTCSDEIQLDEKEQNLAADAAAGLTRMGVEDATALSLIRHGNVTPSVIFDLKAQALSESENSMELSRSKFTLDDYGGGAFIKQFCCEVLSERHENPKFRPKGILLLGPPGVGKTYFSECLGNTVGRPTVKVTLGALKSKFQGQSFENLIGMLEKLEAMAPMIAFLDEVEGQVSGGKDTGSMDAGTTSQINSKLLSWLNDCQADIFRIASCNDITSLMRDMPEFARMGRFDGMFFLDYPDREAKDDIWKIHLRNYELIGEKAATEFEDIEKPVDDYWTGSEIEACCRLARLRHRPVSEIGEFMPTINDQAEDCINKVRHWANGRCFSSEHSGLYNMNDHVKKQREEKSTKAGNRRILRDKQA